MENLIGILWNWIILIGWNEIIVIILGWFKKIWICYLIVFCLICTSYLNFWKLWMINVRFCNPQNLCWILYYFHNVAAPVAFTNYFESQKLTPLNTPIKIEIPLFYAPNKPPHYSTHIYSHLIKLYLHSRIKNNVNWYWASIWL